MKRLFFTLLFLLLASFAYATNRFVDNGITGDCADYNPATQACGTGSALGYKLFNTAAAAVAAGDNVYYVCHSGAATCSYFSNAYRVDSALNPWAAGTSGARVTISGCPAALCGVQMTPTLAAVGNGAIAGLPNYTTVAYFYIDASQQSGNQSLSNVSGTGIILDHIEFDGKSLDGVGHCLLAASPTDVGNIVRNSYCHNILTTTSNQYHGFYISAPNWTVEDNTFDTICTYSIHVFSAIMGRTSNAIVRRNTIKNDGKGNANCLSQTSAGIVIVGAADAQVYNNKTYNGNSICLQVGLSTNAKIVENICSNNGSASAVSIGPSSTNAVVENNILWSTTVNSTISDSGTGTTLNYNLCKTGCTGANSINGSDPLFTDAAAFDFSLQAGSPALNAGATLGAPFNTDFANVARPQGAGYDIGAYEKITAAATWNLAVNSVNPASGCAITITPNGNGGDCSANTPIATCTYDDGTTAIRAVAAATCGGNDFTSWTGDCSSQGTVPRGCDIASIVSDRTITANYSTPTGQVLWLKSDEGSGTNLADSSGQANTGTLTAGTSWSAYRGVNTPVYDSTHSATVAASASFANATNAFTLRLSVLPDTVVLDAIQTIIANNSNTLSWGLAAFDETACGPGSTFFYFKSDAGLFFNVCDPYPLSATVATRIAVRYDGTTLTMSKQGRTVATSTPGAVMIDGSSGSVTIGKRTCCAGSEFGGKAWNIIFDDRWLTDAEILADAPPAMEVGGKIAFGGKIGIGGR